MEVATGRVLLPDYTRTTISQLTDIPPVDPNVAFSEKLQPSVPNQHGRMHLAAPQQSAQRVLKADSSVHLAGSFAS